VPLNARGATIGKITYERGKRVTFGHSHLTNLKASIYLVFGHGDQSVRASCSVDFFSIASDDLIPVVYELEVGMDRPSGDRFGTLSLSFQLMPLREFQDATSPALTRAIKFPENSAKPARRISVTKTEPARPMSATGRSAHAADTRSPVPSIHERYMKRNELWIGNHASTHADGDSRRTSRPESGQSSRTPLL
jgi:hypothetical protein